MVPSRNHAVLTAPVILAVLSCIAPLQSIWAEDEPKPGTGSIQCVVRYIADSERPWKFSRYYVKNPDNGFLAEAVVALNGPIANPTPKPARTVTIDQIDFQFVPETIAIRSGDSVRFTNSDESLHNVMTTDGSKPFNVNMPKGGEHVHSFITAGGTAKPIRLGCVYHGGMRAWIFVFDHPWFGVTSRDGQFHWKDVPPGKYTLQMVHPAGRLESQSEVEVKANESAQIEIIVSPDNIRTSKP